MTVRYSAEVISSALAGQPSGGETVYSSPDHDALLAVGERWHVQARFTKVIGSPSVKVYLETSNDRSNWITLGPVIDESPVFEGQVAGGSKGPGLVVGAYMRVYVASSIVVGDGVFLSVSIDSRSE